MTREEMEGLYLNNYKKDSEKGLILEVDLVYPRKLHNEHKDYPLAPGKREITEDMLSEYSK